VDEDGAQVFVDEDTEWLRDEADATALYAIYKAAVELNALTQERVEDIRKNSEPAETPAASSP
jgi:hypothetical protein